MKPFGLKKCARFLFSLLNQQMVHLNFQILYDCNFRCQICDFWKSPHKEMPKISLAQVRLISQKLKAMGPMIISIGGGEPLMHPELLEITHCLAQKHFPVMICNGWFVNVENSRALFKAGLQEVSVSLDYISAAKHDQQRGMAGAYERAINSLKILQQNRTSPHQRVILITVVMDDNLEDIEPLILLARKLDILYTVTLYSSSRGRKQCRQPLPEVANHLLKLKKKYPHFVSLPGYLKGFSPAARQRPLAYPCYAGKNLINIDCQGAVSLCIDTLAEPVGNIFSDDIAVLRQKLLKKHSQNTCSDCWTSCRGSIETLMYGKDRLSNLWHSYQFVKKIPLAKMAGQEGYHVIDDNKAIS
jgi:MoaA/NifB/PqqE/SkfB family radical SAM enzyme